jgi:hypothetical protein
LNLVRYQHGKGSRVVRIPPKIFQLASLPAKAYRNYRVMRMTLDNIQTASVFIGGKESFTLERSGADWRIRRGEEDLGPASVEAARYINRLSTLKAMGIKDPSYSAETCEKSPHRVRVSLDGVASRQEAIYFSYGKEKKLTACSNQRSSLFEIHRDLLKYLEPSTRTLIGR